MKNTLFIILKVVLCILGFILFFVGIVGIVTGFFEKKLFSIILCTIFSLLFISGGTLLFYVALRNIHLSKSEVKKILQPSTNPPITKDATIPYTKKTKTKAKTVVGTHISGLDIPGNVGIVFTLDADGIVIKIPASKEYSISLNKIQSISCYHETEIQNITTSSLGSAVVGAAAFGAIGAIIGSRPKNKEQRTVLFYLLIQYDDKAILIESKDGSSVGRVVDYFRKLKPSSGMQRIEL